MKPISPMHSSSLVTVYQIRKAHYNFILVLGVYPVIFSVIYILQYGIRIRNEKSQCVFLKFRESAL